MTFCLQVVDRHLGKPYKTAVYKIVRGETMRRLRLCDAGEYPPPLTAMEKRILITFAVAATHKVQITKTMRAFHATGTWLPLDGSEDANVSLQGLNYNYVERVTPEKVAERVQQMDAEDVLRIARMTVAEQEAAKAKVLHERAMKPSVRKGTVVWRAAEGILQDNCSDIFTSIMAVINCSFVVAGSYAAAAIVEAIKEKFPPPQEVFGTTLPDLKYHDIDVYYGREREGVFRLDKC